MVRKRINLFKREPLIKISSLPKLVQFSIFRYFTAKTLWEMYQVNVNIFSEENNVQWKCLFGETIKFSRE